MYLRKNMDSRGWVPLTVIANFNRVKALTEDVGMVRFAVGHAKNIEFRSGDDGVDRLRTREEWEFWVLKMDERLPEAQHDGPSSPIHRRQQPSGAVNGFSSHPMMSPTSMQGPNSNHDPFADNSESVQSRDPTPSAEPNVNGHNSTVPQPPLSATVPPFTPAPELPNIDGGGQPRPNSTSLQDSPFPDEQIDNLMIIVRKTGDVQQTANGTPPFVNGASRTFSNGSIDEDIRSQRPSFRNSTSGFDQ